VGVYVVPDVEAGTYSYTLSRFGYQTVSGTIEVVDQPVSFQVTMMIETTPRQPKSPIFEGLQGEYQVGDPSVVLHVIGAGTEGKTFTCTVNGTPTTTFTPSVQGKFLIEAISNDRKLRIRITVSVK
jgi:hypothetical protein